MKKILWGKKELKKKKKKRFLSFSFPRTTYKLFRVQKIVWRINLYGFNQMPNSV